MRSVVEHVRVADNVPTIATVRWECTECDWRSDPPPGEDTGGCELNIHRPAGDPLLDYPHKVAPPPEQ